MRYYNYFKLYRSARYVSTTDNFFQTHLWKYFLLEFVAAVIHPNIFVNGKMLYNIRLYLYILRDMEFKRGYL